MSLFSASSYPHTKAWDFLNTFYINKENNIQGVFSKMTTENENNMNEAELSDVKNSIASLCKKYLTGSFFDKLADTSGIKIAKDILLGDLKNLIGKGTSGPAAKKFANAIQMAKNPVAVDTIMSNYMLKGDGMGSAIGYTESTEIKPFQEFLTEARKGGCCGGGKKKPSEEEIEEAIKVVEAEGYRVRQIEESKEEKSYVTEEEIENAKKIVESRGYRVIEKTVSESAEVSGVLEIPTYDYDQEEVADLIKYALADTKTPTYLRSLFTEVNPKERAVEVKFIGTDEPAEDLDALVSDFVEGATGLEAEFDEDLLDYFSVLFKRSIKK